MADDETKDPEDEPSLEELAEAIRQIEVGQFLLTSVSTLASLAFAKLEQRELVQAKTAIDAIQALLPVLRGSVDEGLLRDFERALTNLQLAYAGAASNPQG